MPLNPSISLLDPGQLFKRMYDPVNDCIRVSTEGNSGSTKVSLTSSNTGDVIVAQSAVGIKSLTLYTNTTANITGAQLLTVYANPSDTDNVWIATTCTITPSTTAGVVVVATTLSTIVARQIKVSIASAISSGTFDLYLVYQGN